MRQCSPARGWVIGPSPAADVRLATIERFTGAIGPGPVAEFSDGYTDTCNVLSASASELFCLEDPGTIRRYRTTSGSPVLELAGTITLSRPLPPIATCEGGNCHGGSFAWDGVYFYFARSQTSSSNLDYDVFQEDGTYIATYTAAGGGALDGVYFDWSVGRYAIHDRFGNRTGGTVYSSVGGNSDSQCYGGVSIEHTLLP